VCFQEVGVRLHPVWAYVERDGETGLVPMWPTDPRIVTHEVKPTLAHTFRQLSRALGGENIPVISDYRLYDFQRSLHGFSAEMEGRPVDPASIVQDDGGQFRLGDV